MAKEDFCFTYYDGDAARDMQHMDRLTRGAYNDLIIMQRKVGKLEMKHIKMVLGSDFEKCWSGLEFILKADNEKYFIEWVEVSVEKSKENSKKNKKKIEDYWNSEKGKERKKILNSFQNDTMVSKKNTNVIPLEDVYVNGYVNEDIVVNKEIEIFKIDEKLIFPNSENLEIELPTNELFNCKVLISNLTIPKVFAQDEDIRGLWTVFKAIRFNGQNQYYGWNKVYEHFKNDLKSQIQLKKIYKDGKTVNGNNGETKLGTSDARIKALKDW
jgi:hypothetical protein